MIIKKSLLALGVSSLLLAAASASAKVSPEQAERLGKDLTPFGAEKAGNREGTIPAWNPEFVVPNTYKGAGTHYTDPYVNEKPLFTITAENLEQYQDKLSPGQRELFKLYPKTYQMPVYSSHRDNRYSDFVAKNTYRNALRAELVLSGDGVENAFGGLPFPIPQNGNEAIWNLGQAGTPFFAKSMKDDVLVYRDGNKLLGKSTVMALSPYFDTRSSIDEFQANGSMKLFMTIQGHAPARDKGGAALVHLPLNTADTPRSAWSYSPGVRRVRRAPSIGYDNFESVGKFRTVDSGNGFNGSTDRYDWKLVGKKEIYIPYNNYKFEQKDLSFDKLLPVNHPNPDYMRYELHRVWVVEATLKKNQRNVFKKRVIYLDEDSWIPAVTDMYDSRDQLWRVTQINSINQFDLPGVVLRSSVYFDLFSREYLAENLYNQSKTFPINDDIKEMAFFKPATLRKLGVR